MDLHQCLPERLGVRYGTEGKYHLVSDMQAMIPLEDRRDILPASLEISLTGSKGFKLMVQEL